MNLLTTLTTIAGFRKTTIDVIKSGIDIIEKAKNDRATKKAEAQTAFKKLRFEANFICKGSYN